MVDTRYLHRFDWYVDLRQWAIGFSLRPRGEYAIEIIVGPVVLTFRWRDGWTFERKNLTWMRTPVDEQGATNAQ